MKHLWSALALGLTAATAGQAVAQPATKADAAVHGQWDGVLSRNGVDIPFRFDIKNESGGLHGVFYDGWTPYDGTTSATFANGQLELKAEHYLSAIKASLKNGVLTGSASAQTIGGDTSYTFRATRHAAKSTKAASAPSIEGSYIIPLTSPSSKGEKAFRFVVRQRGDEVAAAILRIDGDTGAYTGIYKDGKWVLGHFDGGRPGVIVVTPKPDGQLEILQASDGRAPPATDAHGGSEYSRASSPNGGFEQTLVAYRADIAKAKGLPEPDDALTHTKVRDPNEQFKFSFPDLQGKLISQDDPRFKNKVVIAVITGTWCPNCHDEAQYLVKLDEKYRDRGLAIVALNFEEVTQHEAGFERARAFIEKYGVKYTYLNAGSPAEMWEKVPQLVHLDTWPATVFVGRDGLVDAVHSGFASPASGEFHDQLQRDFEERIEKLLAKPASTQAASLTSATQTAFK